MKDFDRLMLMYGSSASEPSLSSKQLSDNDDEPDLQEVLISGSLICQILRMRINKLKNKKRQNLNHQRNFSIKTCFSNFNSKGMKWKWKNVCILMSNFN